MEYHEVQYLVHCFFSELTKLFGKIFGEFLFTLENLDTLLCCGTLLVTTEGQKTAQLLKDWSTRITRADLEHEL